MNLCQLIYSVKPVIKLHGKLRMIHKEHICGIGYPVNKLMEVCQDISLSVKFGSEKISGQTSPLKMTIM